MKITETKVTSRTPKDKKLQVLSGAVDTKVWDQDPKKKHFNSGVSFSILL